MAGGAAVVVFPGPPGFGHAATLSLRSPGACAPRAAPFSPALLLAERSIRSITPAAIAAGRPSFNEDHPMGYFSRIIGPVAIAAMVAPCHRSGRRRRRRAACRDCRTQGRVRAARNGARNPHRSTGDDCNGGSRCSGTGRTAASGAVGTRPQFLGVQSCDLGDPGRQLRRPVAGPGRLQLRRLHAERRRDRTGRSQLQPRRVRGDVRGQRRSVLHRRADHGAVGRRRNRRRGGVRSHHVAARGILGEGRALLLRLRLPQRNPRARVGLRRPAARVPGLLWRAVRPGRRAGEVARADGPVPRVRRRDGQRR